MLITGLIKILVTFLSNNLSYWDETTDWELSGHSRVPSCLEPGIIHLSEH